MDARVADVFLVNEPGGDSGLYVELAQGGRALLFDCGEMPGLSVKQRLKVSDVFVSHTHMDHFIGFDRLFRAALSTDHRFRLFGPPPLAAQVHHKLLGYTWNLIQPPDVQFEVREASGEIIEGWRIGPEDQYQERTRLESQPDEGVAHRESELWVEYRRLQHTTPSFGYALVLDARWRVDSEKLKEAGYLPGPWISELLERLKSPEVSKKTTLEVSTRTGDRNVPIGQLTETFLTREPPWRLAYVTDTGYSPAVETGVAQLAANADLLVCEAVFVEEDADRANRTQHLTARQCGHLARIAGAKRLKTFHYSKRYPSAKQLLSEVREVYPDAE